MDIQVHGGGRRQAPRPPTAAPTPLTSSLLCTGSADSEAIDNWSRVLQWWMLMVGEKGSGMYFHKDGLACAPSPRPRAPPRPRVAWPLAPGCRLVSSG